MLWRTGFLFCEERFGITARFGGVRLCASLPVNKTSRMNHRTPHYQSR